MSLVMILYYDMKTNLKFDLNSPFQEGNSGKNRKSFSCVLYHIYYTTQF